MPKDKVSESEPKKKMVVVEEVEVEETPTENQEIVAEEKVEEKETKVDSPKVEQVQEVVEDEDNEDKPNYLWIIVPTALLVGALVGGLITYFSGVSNQTTVEVTPTPVATTAPQNGGTEPTATPSSTLKRDSLKVQVLNGSGVSGLAGKVKTMLEGLGYKGVVAGNASSSDFEKTEVAIKESKKEYLDLVIKDLSSDYEAVEAEKALPANSSYDVVITVGKK